MQVTVWPRGGGRAVYSGPLGSTWESNPRTVGKPVHNTDVGQLRRVKYSTRYEEGFGGHDLAEWTMSPFGGYLGGMFRPGDHVRIRKGGGTCFEGRFSGAEPGDDDTIVLSAKGYGHSLYHYPSIYWQPQPLDDDVYYPTDDLGPLASGSSAYRGWRHAIAMGMPISQVVGWTDWGALGDDDLAEGTPMVGDVLSAHTLENGKRWAVWGRTLVIGADNMTPMWAYDAPKGLVGVADDEYATDVWVHFVADPPNVSVWDVAAIYSEGSLVKLNPLASKVWRSLKGPNSGHSPAEDEWWTEHAMPSAPAQWSMVRATDNAGVRRFDPRHAVVDLRGLGYMTSTRASQMAQQMLSQVKGRFILSGSITVGPESGFKSANGGTANIAFVQAGRALRLNNLRTSQGNLMPDGGVFMIGRTEYEWAAPDRLGGESTEQLTITPMGAVPRNLGEILRGVPMDATAKVAGAA